MIEDTRALVGRALQQDRTAVDELFRRHRDRLRRALRKLVGERYRVLGSDSEDATHDAILSALARLDQFEWRGDGSFLAWLLKGAQYGILRRIRASQTKKRDADAVLPLDAEGVPEPSTDDPTASKVASRHELTDLARESLDLLPPRERDVIILRRYMELPVEEVMIELDLPTAGAVRALLSRAQVRLARIMARGGTVEG